MYNEKNLLSKFLECGNVITDSRSTEKGSMFFALKGENFDGNQYAKEAIKNGAKYAVIDNPDYQFDERYILVNDSLIALQNLAREYRQSLKRLKVIAIAGSNGKTTTRDLISRILNSKYNTTTTRGNLNNHIGVPLSILKIKETDEFAVIEIGANHLGEHKILCEIALPNYGIVTNNGKDHLEGYGSIEAVKESNKELYDYLIKNNGMAFVNADDPELRLSSEKLNRCFYGKSLKNMSPNFQVAGTITNKFPCVSVQIHSKNNAKKFIIDSKLFGSFQLYNIMAAIAVGSFFKIENKLIKQAIESYIPTNNRSQFIDWEGNTVLLDAYNANPSSMLQMINDFDEFKVKNKIVVLGDMLELGAESENEHKSVIDELKRKSFKEIILVGNEFGKFKGTINCKHFMDSTEVAKYLIEKSYKDCFFLAKGSRGIAIEKAFGKRQE